MVELEEDGRYLIWDYVETHNTRPDRGLLEQFLRIKKDKGQSVLQFARKWGALSQDDDCELMSPRSTLVRESVGDWNRLKAEFKSVLNLAQSLQKQSLGELDDWHDFYAEEKGPPYTFVPQDLIDRIPPERLEQWKLDMAWSEVAGKVSSLMADGGVAFELRWDWKSQPRTRLPVFEIVYRRKFGSGLRGALALQLALAVSQSEGLFVCSYCGLPYFRASSLRRPKPGQNNYCEDCRKSGFPQRVADQKRRERIEKARQLRSEGLSVEEISIALRTKKKTIENWARKWA